MILLGTIMSVQTFGKQATDCNSTCHVVHLRSQHMPMGNITLSPINDVLSLREGPTFFQSQYSKVLFNPKSVVFLSL